jgi:predicted Zn-dependent peptidase
VRGEHIEQRHRLQQRTVERCAWLVLGDRLTHEILERFKTEKVDEEALSRVKTKTRASLIRRLDNNAGLASLLGAYHAVYGDWRKLFTSLDELNKVSSDDVRRVANQYFIHESRTVAHTYAPESSGRKPSGGTK